ncbi:MAG: hypothetical protein GC191_09055 [Azospirillum sp.]|nr:hypothetical protein [Azospirillum sp.]
MADGIIQDLFKRVVTESTVLVIVLGLQLCMALRHIQELRAALTDALLKLAEAYRSQHDQIREVTEVAAAMTGEVRALRDRFTQFLQGRRE